MHEGRRQEAEGKRRKQPTRRARPTGGGTRSPTVNALAFPIRCYLCNLEDIATQPKWGRRLHRVLRDIDPDLAEYKGFAVNHEVIVDYLAQFDDGAETSPGIFPD